MASRFSFSSRPACLTAALSIVAALLVVSTPASADDDVHDVVKVSSWCGQSVLFTNLTSEEVDVAYEFGVPLSLFSTKDGEFTIDPHETYTLPAYGGQKGGPPHRLFYKAESDDYEQEGYVDQWKYCKKYLVKTYVQCGYVTLTNVFDHKITVKHQEGGDYGEWDDDFWLYPGKSKKIEFDSGVLWFSAESRWGDHYRRQVGTIYHPKKCDEYKGYKKEHDDDDEWELHDAGDFILKIIPFSRGPLLDDVNNIKIGNRSQFVRSGGSGR